MTSDDLKNLTFILESIAFVFPEIGYCQGMNYIAATLNSYLQENEASIGIFMGLISTKKLRGLFTGSVPEYHVRAHVFQRILEEKIPKLYAHFKKMQLKLDMFLCDWFMTLFCGFFFVSTNGLAYAILDNFFLDGWPALYRVSLTILRILEPELILMDDIGRIAARMQILRQGNGLSDLLVLASREGYLGDLDRYELDYFTSQVVYKITRYEDKGEWSKADTKMLPALRERLQKRATPIRKELSLRQMKI